MFYTFSRLSRFTIKYDFFIFSFFSHLQSILQFQKSINNITKRIFITCSKTSYFIIKNFYIMFHNKFKFSSFFVKQLCLFFVFFIDLRQTRITIYFKSFVNNDFVYYASLSKFSLILNKKHVEFKIHNQSTQNRDLTFLFSSISINRFHRTCRRCNQQFNSKKILHKHLTHCNKNIFNCSKYSSSKFRMKKKK